MMRRSWLFLALAVLTACSSKAPTAEPASDGAVVEANTPMPPVDPAPVAAIDTPALAVEAEGLRLFNKQSGAARPIAFGTPRDDVLKMLAFLGKPETGQNAECGAGPLDFANWANGLGLFFQKDRFVGWNLNPRGDVSTASGIGPGSSRADLESAYAAQISQTSLGTEFVAGELFGLLDGKSPAAKITFMWGGVSCNFR
jgi:hypothetical protein